MNLDNTKAESWIEILGQIVSVSSLFGIFGWMIYAVFGVIAKKKVKKVIFNKLVNEISYL